MTTFKPLPRCRHPGCLTICATPSAKLCRTHKLVAKEKRHAKIIERNRTARERKRIEAAVVLLRANGYTVTKSTQPEAFPS